MLDFPRRMREWLFAVMKELADRQELDMKLVDRISHVETELNKKWSKAAVWKFCDLDATHDRSVSRHELFPIRAPLMSLEHWWGNECLSCATQSARLLDNFQGPR